MFSSLIALDWQRILFSMSHFLVEFKSAHNYVKLTSSPIHHHAAYYTSRTAAYARGKARLARRIVLTHILYSIKGGSLAWICFVLVIQQPLCEDWNHPPLTLHDMPENFQIRPVFPTVPSRRLGIYSGGEITIFHRGGFYPCLWNNFSLTSNYQFSGNFHFKILSLKHNCSKKLARLE